MSASDTGVVYRFGIHEVQLRERRLLADGTPAAIGSRGFDLLVALIERAGHLLTKDELFGRVWPKVIVDDSALQFQISALRKIIGADAIATVSGRGYRFMPTVVRAGDGDPDAAGAPRHNLPAAPSSFVGREDDLARLDATLDRARLVTLTGAGGCGKTRLALRVASGALARYPDGVWFVELAALADPALVAQAAMTALAVHESPGTGRTQTLVRHLAERRLLLVLDNAEHLLAACAELADALLRGCRGVALLVTSREALGVAGELTYRVPSLALPDPKQPPTVQALQACDSARLFVERARLLRPHFAPTPRNAAALALICRRLDGIPLALELAAGRMRTMDVEEIGRRLDQRFSLLSAGGQAAPQRHRTLRSLIDWSYDLLAPAEQALLDRLSVFAGGCTLHAAEQVCAADGDDPAQVLDLLASLADKNLLVADDHEGLTRYRLLETVRQYAAERLNDAGQAAAWKGRHLAHYAALGDAAGPQLGGADQRLWFDRLESEHDNLRGALAWAAADAQRASVGLRLANAVARFWTTRGELTEGRAWFAALLAAVPSDGQDALRAGALNRAGTLAAQQGDNPAARAQFETALALFRALGDARNIASVLNNLGICAQHDGDYPRACELYEENIAILRTLGAADGLSRSLHNLGDLRQLMGDHAAAQALLEEAVEAARTVGDRNGMAMTLGSLGLIAALQGRYDEVRATFVEVIGMDLDLRSHRTVAYSLEALAFIESSTGALLRAVQLWGAADALRAAYGHALPGNERPEHDERIQRVRATLADEAAFERAWQQGAAMSEEQAVRHAISTCGMPTGQHG